MTTNVDQQITVLNNMRFYLRIHHLWPNYGHRPNSRFYILHFSTLFITFIPFLGTLIEIHHEWTSLLVPFKCSNTNNRFLIPDPNYTRNDVIVLIGEFLSMFGCMCLRSGFLNNITEFADMLIEFSRFSDQNPHIHKVLERYNTYSRIWYHYSSITMLIMGTYRVLVRRCKPIEVTEQHCGLLEHIYMPFQHAHFPAKHFVLLLQIYSSVVAVKTGATISFSIYECTQHIIVRMEMLRVQFKSILNAPHIQNTYLIPAIKEHIAIGRLAHRLDKCYRQSMFIHITMTSSIIGFTSYVLIYDKMLTMIFHIFGWAVLLMAACYAGQQLIDESLSVGDAIYNAKWYQTDLKTQRLIQMILRRAQKPFTLHSGRFVILSLPIFLTIIKTAYSYMTLLQNVA